MKYSIISFFACFLMLAACTKEAEYNPAQDIVYSPKKNAYHATKITGTSTYWGDFNLSLVYSREELDAAYRTNTAGDTVGKISVTRSGSTYLKYAIYDYIPNIDQDSINRMDAELLAKYGAGNYHLWDSLPKAAMAIKEVVAYLYTDGRLQKLVDYTYRPRENTGTTGVDFNNNYILVTRTSSTYEYNLNSDVCIIRMISDLHDPKDKELYERSLYKNEVLFDGEQIVGMVSYTAKGGDNFKETNRYNFLYNDNLPASINGTDFTRQFAYNGSKLTLTTNGMVSEYEFDENGNVTRIDDGKGNVFNITYEAGNGNFSLFTPMHEQILNTPFIR